MSFESVSIAWAIPFLALGLSLLHAINLAWLHRATTRLGDANTIAGMTNSLNTRLRKVRISLSIAALVLCLAALARPTVRGKASWRQRGIDIVFVHQFSTSMLAEDVYPSRLARSLKEADLLIDGLQADRVGTVVFAGGAAHFPLTHDHVAARLLYQGLAPSDLAPGADLGQALRLASCMLRGDLAEPSLCALLAPRSGGAPLSSEARGLVAEKPPASDRARVIVLFSDGEDSEGFALQEAVLAKNLGLSVVVVGVGTAVGELVPRIDSDGVRSHWQKDARGKFLRTQLGAELLREVASKSGGVYFSLGEGKWKGEKLLEWLRERARGDLDTRVVRTRTHRYDWFLFPAFCLLIIEGCLSVRRRRVALPLPGGESA